MTKRLYAFALLVAVAALLLPAGGTAFASHPQSNPAFAARSAARVNVAIQAGHWKSSELPAPLARLRSSTGAVGGGRTESQVTLDIAQRAARILRDKGLTVEVLPATVPTGYAADLFISLHADGASSSAARGYKVSTRWRSEVAALDAVLVQSLEAGYGRVTGMPENASVTRAMRGYYAYSTYRGEEYRLGADTPAAILEMGFMTSAADRSMMFNRADTVARGVVAGVENFYARLPAARKLQAEAERKASASSYGRSAVILADTANLRDAASTSARRVAGAEFGDAFPLLESSTTRPGGSSSAPRGPGRGTQLVTGSGWYKVSAGSPAGEAFISRDLVVVQQ